MGKGKGKSKGRGKTKPDKPDRAPQSAPYLPKSSSRPAPHATVTLTTYELLEAILLRLDEHTLLVSAQRVNTLWRRVVTTSLPLQRRLFFLPSPPATTPRTRKFNPFLQHAFPCLFPPSHHHPNAILPPFLRATTTAFIPAGAWPSDFRPPILDTRFGGARHRACVRVGSSWRRMLPADPPPRRVVRTSVVPGGGGVPEVARLVDVDVESRDAEGGVTMGEYYDAVCDVNFRRRDGSGKWGAVEEVRGAWAAWRWEVRVGGEGGGGDAGEGGGLVAGVDLVIGELGREMWWDWGELESPGCRHWDGPKGRFCLLRPERRGMALYRSEEYCARERLWLGPPVAERQVHEDRTGESWEDWEDESDLESAVEMTV